MAVFTASHRMLRTTFRSPTPPSTVAAPPAPPSSLATTPSGQGACRAVSAELVVMRLQQQLREKDLKLTDVRLEALSSAHQLDSLRDAMNRMRVSFNEFLHRR